jgi:translation initiation factor IF-3
LLLEVINRANSRMYPQVRLVGEDVNEIVPVQEALRRAEEEGLDLCLMSDKSNPPVVRLQDFKKLLYEQKKAKSKQQKGSELKEIQLKINISDHDLQTKINSINKFIERGDKVKIVVRLRGRERESPQRAKELLERVTSVVSKCKVSTIPGPIAIALLEPVKA